MIRRMATNDEQPLLNFAAIEWPARWNDMKEGTPVAAIDQVGGEMVLTTCLGFVKFDRAQDGPHLLRQLEAAVELLRNNL